MYILGRYVLLAFFLAVMVDVYAETNPVILQRKLFGILSKYKSKKLSRNFGKFVGVRERGGREGGEERVGITGYKLVMFFLEI